MGVNARDHTFPRITTRPKYDTVDGENAPPLEHVVDSLVRGIALLSANRHQAGCQEQLWVLNDVTWQAIRRLGL